MDSASADLASVYWADPIMRTLPLPAFGIPEVNVHLKFAVSNLVATGVRPASPSAADMRIVIDLASLEKVPAHLISEIELRLTPQMVAVAEAEAEEPRRARK